MSKLLKQFRSAEFEVRGEAALNAYLLSSHSPLLSARLKGAESC